MNDEETICSLYFISMFDIHSLVILSSSNILERDNEYDEKYKEIEDIVNRNYNKTGISKAYDTYNKTHNKHLSFTVEKLIQYHYNKKTKKLQDNFKI